MSNYTIVYNDFTVDGLVVGESQYCFESFGDAVYWLESMNYYRNGDVWIDDESPLKGYAIIKEI